MTATAPIAFFVLGHPRSGTTALARLLNASDKVACIFYEGNLLYRLNRILSRHHVLEEPHTDLITDFDVTARHNLIDKPNQSGILKPVFSEASVAAIVEGFAKDLKKMQDPKALFRSTAERFFQSFAGTDDFCAIGDKVPDYINIPEKLQVAMPKTKLLYIKRDPRAVVHSVLRFAKDGLHLFAVSNALPMSFAWILRHCGMERFRHRVEAERLLVLQQEDLRTDPLSIAEKTLEFLEVSLDAPTRRHVETISKRQGTKDWRSEMAPEDVNAVESAVFQSGFAHEIGSFLHDPRQDGWFEKTAAIMPLTDCTTEQVPGLIQTAKGCFREQHALETLGLTLVQFADWAHLKADDDRAETLFEEAAHLLSEDPVFQYKYGEFCFNTKRLEFARSAFQGAMETCPDTEYFRFLRAKIFYQLGITERLNGKIRKARDFFKKSLDVSPNYVLPKAILKTIAD